MTSTPSGADSSRHDRWFRIIGYAISIASVVGVVWWASKQPAPSLPNTRAELAALVASLAAYTMATLVRGERAYRLLAASGAEPTRADAYGLVVVGYMGNTVLPARGGDAMRVYLQAPRANTSMRNVIGTLVAERVLDAVTLLSLFVVLAYGVLEGIDAPSGTRLAIIAGGLAIIAGGITLAVYLARDNLKVARALAFLAPITIATRSLRGRHGATMLGLTLVIWAFEAATYLLVADAVSLQMNPLEALYIVALTSVFVLIPAGPGYAGTLDAAVLFGVHAIGGDGSEAVSYLITLRFILLVPITIAGLVLVLTRYGGWHRVREAAGLSGAA